MSNALGSPELQEEISKKIKDGLKGDSIKE